MFPEGLWSLILFDIRRFSAMQTRRAGGNRACWIACCRPRQLFYRQVKSSVFFGDGALLAQVIKRQGWVGSGRKER